MDSNPRPQDGRWRQNHGADLVDWVEMILFKTNFKLVISDYEAKQIDRMTTKPYTQK